MTAPEYKRQSLFDDPDETINEALERQDRQARKLEKRRAEIRPEPAEKPDKKQTVAKDE